MQSKPLITLDDVLLRYCSSHRVVTANERLANALVDAYARRHQDVDAAPAACVSTLVDYLCERYPALAPIESRTLLSAETQRLVWLEHTPDIAEIDFGGLYPRIADAWRVMHDWNLTPLLEQFDDNENHRLFRDWSQLYMQTARQRSWITEAELPAAIESAVLTRRLPAETLLLLGFDVVPPSLERMLDAYRSMGATIHRFESAHAEAANVVAASCNDPEQELRAAIHWARSTLSAASEPRSICIAVPDLVESHDRVVRQLEAAARSRAQRIGQPGFGHAGGLKPEPHGLRRQHLLPRHPTRLREHRAQALMTRHQILQRALQRSAVERAHKPHRNRDQVGAAA